MQNPCLPHPHFKSKTFSWGAITEQLLGNYKEITGQSQCMKGAKTGQL